MKKNQDRMVPQFLRHPSYSGLEPFYSREFIENEDNAENLFYSSAGLDFFRPSEEETASLTGTAALSR